MIFLALVTFEHDDDDGEHLPLEFEGACGWMAVEANDAQDAVEKFGESLAEVGLKLVETDQVQVVEGAAQAESIDAHLAENMRSWESARAAVWGTLHCYYVSGSGE